MKTQAELHHASLERAHALIVEAMSHLLQVPDCLRPGRIERRSFLDLHACEQALRALIRATPKEEPDA